MRTVLLALALLCAGGCSAVRPTESYPHEPCIRAEIVCTDARGTIHHTELTGFSSEANYIDIWWHDVIFEILAPSEYAGKKITFPVAPESIDCIAAQKIYEISLPVSVIEGKPNALGYFLDYLGIREANKPPEAMAVKCPPSNQSPTPTMPHL